MDTLLGVALITSVVGSAAFLGYTFERNTRKLDEYIRTKAAGSKPPSQ